MRSISALISLARKIFNYWHADELVLRLMVFALMSGVFNLRHSASGISRYHVGVHHSTRKEQPLLEQHKRRGLWRSQQHYRSFRKVACGEVDSELVAEHWA